MFVELKNEGLIQKAVFSGITFDPPLFANRPDFHSQGFLLSRIRNTHEAVLEAVSGCDTYEKFADIALNVIPKRLFAAIEQLPNKDELNRWLSRLEKTV